MFALETKKHCKIKLVDIIKSSEITESQETTRLAYWTFYWGVLVSFLFCTCHLFGILQADTSCIQLDLHQISLQVAGQIDCSTFPTRLHLSGLRKYRLALRLSRARMKHLSLLTAVCRPPLGRRLGKGASRGVVYESSTAQTIWCNHRLKRTSKETASTPCSMTHTAVWSACKAEIWTTTEAVFSDTCWKSQRVIQQLLKIGRKPPE